jgi:hypothetical protein
MASLAIACDADMSPLERFMCDYLEVIGGAWDKVEPQVYDLLLPVGDDAPGWDAAVRGIVRVAFDPEAMAEHRGAQLASFGAPLVDGWLDDAMMRGQASEQWLVGLNLSPHDLPNRVRRSVTLAPSLRLSIARIRSLDFPQAVFWFQATFLSDQKEQEVVPVALDLHYLRQVRHLDQLLDFQRLAEQPPVALCEVRRSSIAAAYGVAQERVLRTFATLAHTRSRELNERTERQIARMRRYYADMRNELHGPRRRVELSEADQSKLLERRQTIEREEHLRVAELRQKSTLELRLKLLNLLIVRQPKLLLRVSLVRGEPATGAAVTPHAPRRQQPSAASAAPRAGVIDLVWDPLTETLEAPCCAVCERPTFSLDLTRQGQVSCPDCAAALALPGKLARRCSR